MHPARDAAGHPLSDFVIENFYSEFGEKPQTINLKLLLDEAFTTGSEAGRNEPCFDKVKQLLLALIESGQRHTMHLYSKPVLGVHPCAREGRNSTTRTKETYCRYLFPRDIFIPTDGCIGEVREDPYRPDLRNLYKDVG